MGGPCCATLPVGSTPVIQAMGAIRAGDAECHWAPAPEVVCTEPGPCPLRPWFLDPTGGRAHGDAGGILCRQLTVRRAAVHPLFLTMRLEVPAPRRHPEGRS
jgi:hypothetical protein